MRLRGRFNLPAVDVAPLNILGGVSGGVPAVTSFSDTFNRGTLNTSALPSVWVPTALIPVPATPNLNYGNFFATVGPPFGLVMAAVLSGTTSSASGSIMPCYGLTYALVNGKTQFAQATFQQLTASSGIDAAHAIMISNNGQAGGSWYGMQVHVTDGSMRVGKNVFSGGVLTQTLAVNFGATTAGDVWRISFNTATNQLVVTKNGTVVSTQTDGSPLTAGIPGFGMVGLNSAGGSSGSVTMNNFSCGLGT